MRSAMTCLQTAHGVIAWLSSKTDIVPLSAFLMLISVLFFSSMSALRSAGDRLFFDFVMFTSARSDLTLSNLEPRVSTALCQRLVAGRNSGIMGFQFSI